MAAHTPYSSVGIFYLGVDCMAKINKSNSVKEGSNQQSIIPHSNVIKTTKVWQVIRVSSYYSIIAFYECPTKLQIPRALLLVY